MYSELGAEAKKRCQRSRLKNVLQPAAAAAAAVVVVVVVVVTQSFRVR
jgi:ABC-type uncharacterized transport system permease subunit